MKISRTVPVVVFLLLSIQWAYAQKIAFNYLGLEQGLSRVSVMAIQQDSIGRIWVGTRDGLNVYDGNKVKVYRPTRSDSTSILGLNIMNLVTDQQKMWVVTYEGISCLNFREQAFEQYPLRGVHTVLPYKGHLLVGTESGLLELNTQTKKLQLKPDVFNQDVKINSLHTDPVGLLWICSNGGLYVHNPVTSITKLVLKRKVLNCFTDSKKRLWVGTDGDGIYVYGKQQELLQHLVSDNTDHTLVNNVIRSISEDTQGRIWAGTFMGLSIFDGTDYRVQNYIHNDNDQNSLSHNSIRCILRDRQGTMWLGTYFGGVSYFNPDYQIYTKFPVRNEHQTGTGYRVIGKMIEDHKKNIWIATEGSGLDYYNRTTKEFSHFQLPNTSTQNVKSLLLANNRTLYYGTHLGGFSILDTETNTTRTFLNDPTDSTSIQSNVVSTIIPFRDYYLLGTQGGILKFDPKTEEFSYFLKKKEQRDEIGQFIFSLLEDSFGTLWIGTEKQGLAAYNIKTGKLKRYLYSPTDPNSISSNAVYKLYEDKQSRLWIGTFGGGLNLYSRKQDHFINYNENPKHENHSFIYGIQESQQGDIWLSTSSGLQRLDIEKGEFYNYQKSSGFPLAELNEGSFLLTTDGTFFAGGMNGLVTFTEKDILTKPNDFNLIFTSLVVNNDEVIPNDASGILTTALAYSKAIVLNPEHNVFTVNYSACNYIPTNQSNFQYQLENFDDQWQNIDNQTSVTFTNLDPGNYTLHIRGLNSLNQEVVNHIQLKITVNPPLYRTWYAYTFYICFVLLIFWWINRVSVTKVRLLNKLESQEREQQQMDELNQSKLRFFTNISHEFRTPLTLITGTLEAVIQQTPKSTPSYHKLETVNRNAHRLNGLISELLDFRKLEQGYLQLKVSEYKLHDFLQEIHQSFIAYAQERKITYQFTSTSPDVMLWFDRQELEKVFYNLISNAFKFVGSNTGSVTIEIVDADRDINIIIRDNGLGMSSDQVDKIFDRFYQIDNLTGEPKKHSSGLGLALCKGIVERHSGKIDVTSQPNQGASFSVRLQKGNRHFSEQELTQPDLPIASTPILSPTAPKTNTPTITHSTETPTLLLVEDNPEVRQMLLDLFQSNYNILEAPDGKEGLRIAVEQQPNIIISDVMMPNMPGTEMCMKLKQNVLTCHIPIILLTARTAFEHKIEGIEIGTDDYITKPYSTQLLQVKVVNLLRNRALMHDKFRNEPLVKVSDITTNTLDTKLLEQAKAIVEDNIDNPNLDVNTFAREMNLGRTRLYAKIKGVTGQTPNDFILSIRLKKAASLLISKPDMNVSEVAYAVGFNTPRYFSRCFREHFGVSPSKYGNSTDTE